MPLFQPAFITAGRRDRSATPFVFTTLKPAPFRHFASSLAIFFMLYFLPFSFFFSLSSVAAKRRCHFRCFLLFRG